jgi:hypothetical protein
VSDIAHPATHARIRATAYAAQTDRLPHKIVLIAVVTMTIAG